MNLKKKNVWIGLIFLIFGLMTILSGGRSLFTESGIATRGNIVPLVLSNPSSSDRHDAGKSHESGPV